LVLITLAHVFHVGSLHHHISASLGQIPEIVQKALLALVSLRRLCGFLNSDAVEHCTKQRGSLISLDHATVTWPSRKLEADEVVARELFRLNDMNLRFPDNARFVLVCGPTGSGKVSVASSTHS
jgi:ABC-type multidrug transport system fused ATPase/permease subunit